MTPQDMPSSPAASGPRVVPPSDFHFTMAATFTDVAIIGPVPEGFRIDAHYEGTITAGALTGGVVRGVDYLLIRNDGVTVLDVRETITPRGARPIGVRAHGYGSMRSTLQAGAGAAPPQGASFAWPDAPLPLLGVATCQTAAPDLLWMNAVVLVFSGTANLGTRELHAAGRVLTSEMVGPSG